MTNFWNDRYSEEEYAYGTAPNAFFKEIIDPLTPGKILVPGAGEGRDAVYAAKLGWEVYAFDLSTEGRKKALQLAEKENVDIHYEIRDAADFPFFDKKFDLVAMIFFHLPPGLRQGFHKKLPDMLNPGGVIIIEAFDPRQINNSSGGPREISLLYTAEMLRSDFPNLTEIINSENETELNEGLYHIGKADVVRYVGKLTDNLIA
ncbi:MAG: class I SAM-dependent methyltransferase [Saprospiraceae bacterium]|nr:class I SAM-dependent methyltransferase [Saprospiraceae bacterium]